MSAQAIAIMPAPSRLGHDCLERLVGLVPGLALAGGVAFAAIELGKIGWLQANGISALTLAIVLGMLVGNTAYPRIAATSAVGVAFSKQNLLRLCIILYACD